MKNDTLQPSHRKPKSGHFKNILIVSSAVWISCLFSFPQTIARKHPATSGFWAPLIPPRALYSIECRIEPESGILEGKEIIRFKNTARSQVEFLALDWALTSTQTLKMKIKGVTVPVVNPSGEKSLSSPLLFRLPQPLPGGKDLEIEVEFSRTFQMAKAKGEIKLTVWHPKLWWGLPAHGDYEVKVRAPAEYTLATSGRLDQKSGCFRARGVRSFGLYLGKHYLAREANAGDVLVRAVFTPKAENGAAFLLETAADVIRFYKQRFGFYPNSILTIIPGEDEPMGGYPFATNIVVIHGQEKIAGRTDWWWRWITAHEIGHQYWLEHVLSSEQDGWGWLMIGLGFYADQAYCQTRNIYKRDRRMMSNYIDGVRKHLDTTVERPPEQIAEVDFDFNNVVTHDKGYSIISALDCLLGEETFDRISKRCLKEYAGKPMGAHEFQQLCERESRQSLGWFFDQWLRTDRFLSYEIRSQKCTGQSGSYVSEVEVACLGTLKMPVPVAAFFQDGSEQVQCTERLLETNIVKFKSASPLKEARIDPEMKLPLVIPPPEMTEKRLAKAVDQMPWSGAGKSALVLFEKAREAKKGDFRIWAKLGLTLYDGEYYLEALEAFRRAAELTDGGAWVIVWQGHVLDLLGRREEALEQYRKALERSKGLETQHDEYGMVINRQWVEERLQTPFHRLI